MSEEYIMVHPNMLLPVLSPQTEQHLAHEITVSINHCISGAFSSINESLVNSEKLDMLMLLGEAYSYAKCPSLFDDIINKTMLEMRAQLSTKTNTLALYGGLAEAFLSANMVFKNTGRFGKFSESIYSNLISGVPKYVARLVSSAPALHVWHYDCVSGASGVLNALLSGNVLTARDAVFCIIDYLSLLTHSVTVPDVSIPVPLWYIKNSCLLSNIEQQAYPLGMIDCGLAHGVAGPLAALSLAVKKDFCKPTQIDSIKRIIDFYTQTVYVDAAGCPFWVGKYAIERYEKGIILPESRGLRMSWCYGSIGILRALQLGAEATHDRALLNWTKKCFLTIATMSYEDYRVDSPTICHGYSGILMSLIIQYKAYGDTSLLLAINKLCLIVLGYYRRDSTFGFYNIESSFTGEPNQSESLLLLSGASGVALSLLATTESTQFEHKLLLC